MHGDPEGAGGARGFDPPWGHLRQRRAELGELGHHIDARPLANRGQENHRRDPDQDPQHGEEGPLAVKPEGLPGQAQQVLEAHALRLIKASTGFRRAALRAGRMPNSSPTPQDTTRAAPMAQPGGRMGKSG